MKVAFLGCVDFSEPVLRRLIARPEARVVGIATRAASPVNADFRSMAPVAAEHGLPCLLLDGNDQEALADWLRGLGADLLVCVGWSYLLKRLVLETPRLGVVGYHPALLPRDRGRHPIIWALALGLERTGSTFFRMDEGADSGPIVSQVEVAIDDADDAAGLYAKLLETALGQIDAFIPALAAGTLVPTPQDESKASQWRKRGKADGQIDWRMPAKGVRNLVRALAKPYPGAHLVQGGADVKVWRAELAPAGPADVEPGRVLAVDGRAVTVQCGDGAVTLIDHEMAQLPKVGACL